MGAAREEIFQQFFLVGVEKNFLNYFLLKISPSFIEKEFTCHNRMFKIYSMMVCLQIL